jgi:putative endonuclease
MRSPLALLGDKGERLAARQVRREGGRLVARNWKTRQGELDLVVLDGGTLAFVEVKSRKSDEYGTPGEMIPRAKRRRIEKLAQYFLRRRRLDPPLLRFDVVEVLWTEPPAVRWIRNAWLAGE